MSKFAILFVLFLFCSQHALAQSFKKMKGVTVILPPDSLIHNPFEEIVSLGADWVCLVPFGFCKKPNYHIGYNQKDHWWGLQFEGIRHYIKEAKSLGLRVMLKPQLYVADSWPGDLDFDNDSDWKNWEYQYSTFLFDIIDIAQIEGAEMLCIGAELNNSIRQRSSYWQELILKIKKRYHGQLTYSANWDAYTEVDFWHLLDYIGISAYFPILDSRSASVIQLEKSLKKIAAKLERYAYRHGKPLIFTEYGYLSVDGCAYQHWVLEEKIEDLEANEKCQSNAYQAIYNTYWDMPVWKGGFLWKWYPLNQGHEGRLEKDYTPQGKQTEEVIRQQFLKTK